ncbi:MAG: condensation domain-containing protein, partial [Tumebacillaceae bacterium]
MSGSSKSLLDLSEKKRQLLQMMLKKEGVAEALVQNQRIPRRTSDDVLPLSFSQQRLWFIDRMGQAGTSYNMPYLLHLQGKLQVDALKGALQEVVERHEILRTTFPMVNGEPVQAIAPVQELPLHLLDVRGLTEQERESTLQKRLAEEASYPFRLAEGPLFRVTLFLLGEEEHHLLLNMHHIVSDGWSMGGMVREIADLYAAFAKGEPSPLEELPIQFADYALWQKEWMQGEVLEKQLAYWKEQLRGAASVLELPTDRPRPPVQTYNGADLAFEMPKSLLDAIKVVGQKAEATLFMTLLAAFHALLYRYTGQGDILVGTPIAGRTRTELESLIGFFVNTLVMRADVSDNPTFRELVDRVREGDLEAFANADVPFETVVERLNPSRT